MPATTEPAPRLNHVFVDLENVHQIDASVIGSKAVNFTLLLGAKQTKVDAAGTFMPIATTVSPRCRYLPCLTRLRLSPAR